MALRKCTVTDGLLM